MTLPIGDDFGGYFNALYGYEPFPWQRRLLETILREAAWPDLLDIPTGLGKTSAIDVALFVLAARPGIAPRRIVLVVDRRVVVDQAAEHARKIQKRLTTATDGPLASVAAALRQLWGGAEGAAPFEIAVLRGGMPRDEAWAHRPDRPVVALSTVDQVGSRLLFRGYGVSAGMAPIHAGLLGHDALILLDEVQLSTAFAETLRAVGERWRPWRERGDEVAQPIPDRWAFVRMSATPVGERSGGDVSLSLDEADLAHPIISQRRGASKLARLGEPITTNKNDSDKTNRAVAEAFAEATVQYLNAGAQRLAVIVNRVATARDIHGDLKDRIGRRADVVLLTGRMRPLDRAQVFGDASDAASVFGRVIAGGSRGAQQRPVIVVSTQTIEAGADFDFDALVTECASLDSLRQRFGRLDRRGELKETHATILIRKDQAGGSQDDPVYGAALARTWSWLEGNGGPNRTVDFGIERFPPLPSVGDLAELCSPIQHAPVMLPAHIDAWAQTNPRGEPDPDVALWLHGPERGNAEVRVVWRADVDAVALNDEQCGQRVEQLANISLAVAPPSSLESISVSLHAFRAWVAREPAVELADVEGAANNPTAVFNGRAQRIPQRAFLVVSKSGARIARDVKAVYPEATVVVPSSYGGIRDGNWNPDSVEPVTDLGDWAQLVHHGRPVLRLVPALLCRQPPSVTSVRDTDAVQAVAEEHTGEVWFQQGLGVPRAVALTAPVAPDVDDPEFKPRDAVLHWLKSSREAGSSQWQRVTDALIHPKAKLRVVELSPSGYFAAVGQRQTASSLEDLRQGADLTSDIVNDDGDGASHIGKEVELTQHLSDVERWARRFCNNVGLGPAIGDDLALAARLHDVGKADPRFQQMLHGGSAIRMAASGKLLAKSRSDAGDYAARTEARERAGYPHGYRHELLSVAMLEHNAAALAQANDPELVLHLVGSHHGWCRPFAPAVDHGPSLAVELLLDGSRLSSDTAHGLALLDSGVAERYWVLTERYGWWTLAWFEALVRLADHRASEESSSVGVTRGGNSSSSKRGAR
jgi:CRISPR-associated endonuclease/helicase Cas3